MTRKHHYSEYVKSTVEHVPFIVPTMIMIGLDRLALGVAKRYTGTMNDVLSVGRISSMQLKKLLHYQILSSSYQQT